MELEEVRQVKNLYKESLLSRDNVIGVGLGMKVAAGHETGEPCIMALVSQKRPLAALSDASIIPEELSGIRTDVIEIGLPRITQTRLEKWRPAPGGVSIGHYQISAGTLGCIVHDAVTSQRLILSNNHVLANVNAANLGDPILQPGAANGGTIDEDTIAHLERFLGINFGTEPAKCNIATSVAAILNGAANLIGSNHRLEATRQDQKAANWVDAACARPLDDSLVSDEILEIGVVHGVSPAFLGMSVRKSGRSTGLTTGTITVMETTITIDYFEGRSARFEGQIVTTPMSQGGDSGSLLVAGTTLQGVALLFAGSEQATIYNPIQLVLDALKVTL